MMFNQSQWKESEISGKANSLRGQNGFEFCPVAIRLLERTAQPAQPR